MEIKHKGNTRIFLFAFFGLVMVFSSYLTYLFKPISLLIDKVLILRENSASFYIWQNPPYKIVLRVYLFNVTNGEAFMNGVDEKLKLQEIGPYTFQETLVNTQTVFNDNGSLSYVPRRSVKFLPELSIGDPMSDRFITTNIPLLAIASKLHDSSMFLNLAVSSLARALDAQPILNLTLNDFFWGYEDRLVDAASKLFPNWIDFKKFGILDRMYDDGNNTITMNVNPMRNTGSKELDEEERGRLYSIQRFNGSPGLKYWGYQESENNDTIEGNSKCNMVEGAYEGTILPPNLKPEDSFRIFRKFVCRPMPIAFNGTVITEHNFNAFYYKFKKGFLDADNPDNECYCRGRDPELCLPSGLSDTAPCYYGFPLASSPPHFFGVDPSLYNKKIEGISPNEQMHDSVILVNPETGILLTGYSRLQINLVMRESKYNAKTAPFNNMILPLFWTEFVNIFITRVRIFGTIEMFLNTCWFRSVTAFHNKSACKNHPSVSEVSTSVYIFLTLLLKVLPMLQVILIYAFAIIGVLIISISGIVVFLISGVINQKDRKSNNLNYNYAPIEQTIESNIPVIRREGWISDLSRFDDKESFK